MPWPRRWLLGAGVFLLALPIAFIVSLPVTLPASFRTRLVAALSERFDSQVELKTLRISLLPRLRVTGDTVVLRHKRRIDAPPLITIQSFSAEANLLGLIRRRIHLERLRLEGLEINVPPGGMDIDDDDDEKGEPRPKTRGPSRGDRAADAPPAERGRQPHVEDSPLVIDDLLSERAVLRILRRTPDKRPRVFDIHHLSMQGAGSNDPWQFTAVLTNPTPPGEINTSGAFGPWNASEPSSTPLDARYVFRSADLGVFKGIRGTLDSTGAFHGVLERIEVDGRADVPEFALEDVGHPVPLETRFHSIVDGTTGNTWLRPVDAKFLRTALVANGGVVKRDDANGRTVMLDVVMDDGRIEDVLRLAVKAKQPPMIGALKLRTRFVLPPGHRDVIEKLNLDGSFEIARARFTRADVQAKVNELSHKAQGDREPPVDDAISDFKGRFAMRDGVVRFSTVSFAVPGARVDLNGAYTLRSEALDFRGSVRLDAKLSQLVTGARSFFLKLVDPLFRRRHATVIPITVKGTVDDPKIGLDIARTLARER